MKIVRFLIDLDAAWQANITCDAAGAGWPIARALRKLPHGQRAFPFPPEKEMPSPGDPEKAICDEADLTELDAMYERIVNRKPLQGQPGDVEIFGRYLFRTLLGQTAWKLILNVAETAEADYVELALSWNAQDRDLNRLNWEMMHGPARFLAEGLRETGKIVPIGIVRVVRSSSGKPEPLSVPPRVLFVVNSDIADEKIRPAAEIMGLIERLESEGRSFHREVLRNASAQLLIARIKVFRPDVVHLIGHGGTEAGGRGRGYLRFRDEEQKKDVEVYAEQILSYLEAAGRTPPIVVLSACQSGGGQGRAVLLGAHAAAPLATELVQRGVPIVVGMAGRVSDTACRLFTRGFGVGLLSGQPLLSAIAAGRCASFAQAAPPYKTVDWAFPAVFISAKVPSDYVARNTVANDPAMRLAGWLNHLQLARRPVFCAREEFFEAYNELLGSEERGTRPAVLGIHMAESLVGIGKTRLLEELAAQALRDGHLPLLFTNNDPNVNVQSCGELAVQVLNAADLACEALEIPPIAAPMVLLCKDLPSLLKNPQLLRVPLLKRELEMNGVTNKAIKRALQADLAQLATAFRAKYPPPPGRIARVVVLLNRVERFGDALTTALLSEWADPAGLGTPQEPVPLIFTFAVSTMADHFFNKWIADAPSRRWIRERALKPFAPGEDMLAYQRILMDPFQKELLPGVSNVPLAINDQAHPKTVEAYEKLFRRHCRGLPGAFLDVETYGHAEAAVEDEYLVAMQDDKWFEEVFARK